MKAQAAADGPQQAMVALTVTHETLPLSTTMG